MLNLLIKINGPGVFLRLKTICLKKNDIKVHSCCFMFLYLKLLLMLPFSLAIHPDKIRIATGQIAGVDKDGRVSSQFHVPTPAVRRTDSL